MVRTYPDNYEALSKALDAGYKVKFATQIGNMIEYILEESIRMVFWWLMRQHGKVKKGIKICGLEIREGTL